AAAGRAGAGLGAATAGRGGGRAAGGGERGGGEVLIAWGGGFGAVLAGGVRMAGFGGGVLVTLGPAGGPFARNSLPGGAFPAEPGPAAGGSLAFKSLAGGAVPVVVGAPGGGCLANAGPVGRTAPTPGETSGCAPVTGAIGRAEGGRPKPGLGATLSAGVTFTGITLG